MASLFGLRCPDFFGTTRDSRDNLSEGVQSRPAIRRKPDAIAQSLTGRAREGVSLPPHSTAQCGLQRGWRCKMQVGVMGDNEHADNIHLILYAV